jgi:hypothetical protein
MKTVFTVTVTVTMAVATALVMLECRGLDGQSRAGCCHSHCRRRRDDIVHLFFHIGAFVEQSLEVQRWVRRLETARPTK